MVGVAKEMPNNDVMVTPGEVQIEFLILRQCVSKVTRRNVSNDDDLQDNKSNYDDL